MLWTNIIFYMCTTNMLYLRNQLLDRIHKSQNFEMRIIILYYLRMAFPMTLPLAIRVGLINHFLSLEHLPCLWLANFHIEVETWYVHHEVSSLITLSLHICDFHHRNWYICFGTIFDKPYIPLLSIWLSLTQYVDLKKKTSAPQK